MKLELNIKTLNNEDVIATSCSPNEIVYLNPGTGDLWKIKDGDFALVTDQNLLAKATSLNAVGFYHYDGNKFVICPTWDETLNEETVAEKHGFDASIIG